jgi:hypothetical protein
MIVSRVRARSSARAYPLAIAGGRIYNCNLQLQFTTAIYNCNLQLQFTSSAQPQGKCLLLLSFPLSAVPQFFLSKSNVSNAKVSKFN